MDRVILHCDLNNFYASVEQKLHPEFKGVPLAVCGDPKERHGIVLAKNYEAKAYGVATGDPIWRAKQKCPNLVTCQPHFEEYVKISKAVHKIYLEYTDLVESFGIDECWLDVTASQKLFGDGETIANTIRERVKNELGLTISVGVSFTKILAKLGSDLKKPDATTVLPKETFMDIIGDLSPSEMIMIGRKTSEKLTKLNIHTIRSLANANPEILRYHFGIVGEHMINAAKGVDNDPVSPYTKITIPKSVSNGTTTARDVESLTEAKAVIYALSEQVAIKLRSYNLAANGVSMSIRDENLEWQTKQGTLDYPTSNASEIAEKAIEILNSMHKFPKPLRTITVGTFKLENKDNIQLSMFADMTEKEEKLENSIDKIRDKYGYNAVKRGIVMQKDLIGNLHEEDDFRPFHSSKTT